MSKHFLTVVTNQTPQSSADLGALTSLTSFAKTFTGDGERIPSAMARKLAPAIAAAKKLLIPAAPEQMAVEIDRLLEFAMVFRVPVGDFKSAIRAYKESLAHLPADLLCLAFKRVCASHKWGMRLPLPSEISGHVASELHERRIVLRKLELMRIAPVEDELPSPSPQELQHVAAMVDEATRALRGAS